MQNGVPSVTPASEPPSPTGLRPVPAVAYLVSLYPAVSHTFIAREIAATRRLGARVHTFSVHAAGDDQVLSLADRAEREQTTPLLAGLRRTVTDVTHLALRHPQAFARGLARTVRSGPGGAKGRLWQLFYLAEAAVLVRSMIRLDLRHVHVHLANNSADVARLACTIGNGMRGSGDRSWTWSLAMHGPNEFADVRGMDLAAKVRDAVFVACISDFCRSQLMTLVEPEHWAKLHVVRMTVDPATYPTMQAGRIARPRPGADGVPLRVVFVGRLVPEKAPMLLLDAVAALPRGCVQLRIVGAGPLHGELSARIRDLGLTRNVTLTGAIGQDDLPAQYGWADAFCLPSLAEGLPVVLMEAMATGLPVVTTRIAGIPELVDDGESGLLVTPGRVDQLAGALLRLRDDALRDRLGSTAAAAVHTQHGERNAARLLELFDPLG